MGVARISRLGSAPKKPNIVVFFTDQQRWDVTGASGNPIGLTPNFDKMAARGAYLENFFTCQPVCGPARSCLQTGMFATQTGCWHNGIPLDRNDPDTLAKLLKRGGYDTAYIGKWHLATTGTRPVPPEQRGGYDYWLASDVLEFTSDAYDVKMYDTNERAVHLPGYLGMIKRLDEALGRLQDAIKSLGLDDNTVVVFASDHGNHFKTRNHEYKRSCHEASIRIPGAIQGPGFDGLGRVTDLVSLIDLPPTVLDVAGLPVPAQMQGLIWQTKRNMPMLPLTCKLGSSVG